MIAAARPLRSIALASLAALTVAACGTEAEAPSGPGAISEGEARALDEAAKMLDAQRLPEGALPDVDPSTEDAPQPDPAADTTSDE
ncbi:MAG: hypothetical protein AAFY81_04085 [Pseudomonadota bacterium]